MNFLEFVGAFVILYYAVSIILWTFLDSDIELAIKQKFGHPISSLRGKVVWITGASSGIGANLAVTLAKYGVKLVLSARREKQLETVKDLCLEKSNGLLARNDVLVLPMDILVLNKHQEFFNTVINHFGKLDILVNNAGRSQRAAWDSIDIEVDREIFELDVFSVINLSRIAVRYFKEINQRGHIAITSSGAGMVPVPFSASYNGAKHALHGYFGSLKVEEPNIDVTLYCPGPVATGFLQECFTENINEKYGKPINETDKRITAERCGELFAVALANKTLVSWVGCFPISLILNLVLYFPNLTKLLLAAIGVKGMKKIREGH